MINGNACFAYFNKIRGIPLCLGIVVGVPAPCHRPNETVVGERAAVDLRGILRAAIRVVNAALRWLPDSDGCLQRSNRHAHIN